MRPYLVRLGALGHIGRLTASDGHAYGRGARVVCRTARGLEIGQVLAAVEPLAGPMPSRSLDASPAASASDGTIVRPVTPEDELLQARLEQSRHEAFEACGRLLDERGIAAVLMDVERLLDGQSLYFYFLGPVSSDLEELTGELAEAYEARVGFREFVEAAERGCGPGCGTDAAPQGGGCGTTGCLSCSVAAACHSPAGGPSA